MQDDGAGFDSNATLNETHVGRKIMHERAERIGATVHLNTAPGHGTRLVLTLPPHPVAGHIGLAAGRLPNPTPTPTLTLHELTVAAPRIQLLLVDDHNLFRRGLRALLEQDERFEVSAEAGDVGEALRRLAEVQPDLILLDNHLPGVHGVNAIPALKEAAPRSAGC